MSETASKNSITIKKYANRRLYNTATSSYVTLEDLSAMVKEGTEFNVFDAKTSEDITRSVLTQIIVEEEGKVGQQNLLPIGFLRQLISFYGDSLQWMVPKYLEQSMESLTGNQDRIREYFKGSITNIFPFGTTLEEMSKQNLSMFERTMNIFSPFSGNLGDKMFAGMMMDQAKTMQKTVPTQKTTPSCASTTNDTPVSSCMPAASCSCSMETKEKTTCSSKTETKTTAPSCTMKTETTSPLEVAPQQTASITNLKPRNENITPPTKTATTPMSNVQAAVENTGTDDMQQKIANLQRQLADLAKSRA